MNSHKKTVSISTLILAVILSVIVTLVVTRNSCPLQNKKDVHVKQDHIVLMNPFRLEPEQEAIFITRWLEVANYMKQQPGFIETNLHKGIKGSKLWFNYAKWRSTEAFLNAISTETFKELTKDFPGEGAPQLYEIHTKYVGTIQK